MREKIDELTETCKRVQAEFENYQKRIDREKAGFMALSKAGLVAELLPVLDSMDGAIENSEGREKEGMVLMRAKLLDALKGEGLSEIPAEGKFDAGFHEVMMKESRNEKEDGIILKQFQKGYALSGKVIRPAKVVVNCVNGGE